MWIRRLSIIRREICRGRWTILRSRFMWIFEMGRSWSHLKCALDMTFWSIRKGSSNPINKDSSPTTTKSILLRMRTWSQCIWTRKRSNMIRNHWKNTGRFCRESRIRNYNLRKVIRRRRIGMRMIVKQWKKNCAWCNQTGKSELPVPKARPKSSALSGRKYKKMPSLSTIKRRSLNWRKKPIANIRKS